jgi:hypothetical protein
LSKISPDPSFSKRGNSPRCANPPFEKGGLWGIFLGETRIKSHENLDSKNTKV